MKSGQFKLKTKDRDFLINLTKTGIRIAKEYERAYILLALDKNKKHEDIEEFYNVSRITIWRIKTRYIKYGLLKAIQDEPRTGQPAKYKDKEKAEIIALACSSPPKGRSRWTIRLLTKTLKEETGLETINRESIRLLLKKTNVSLG